MSKQVISRRASASQDNKPRRTWQQSVFVVLSVLLIVSWIAALLVTL